MKRRSQPANEHEKGRSPVWTRRWALRLKRFVNGLPQPENGHWYCDSPPGTVGGIARAVACSYAVSTVQPTAGTGPSMVNAATASQARLERCATSRLYRVGNGRRSSAGGGRVTSSALGGAGPRVAVSGDDLIAQGAVAQKGNDAAIRAAGMDARGATEARGCE